MSLSIETTERGFEYAQFTDLYDQRCSIQMSSLATDVAIWLGVDTDLHGKRGARMHLNRGHVAALMPLLQEFLDSGYLKRGV